MTTRTLFAAVLVAGVVSTATAHAVSPCVADDDARRAGTFTDPDFCYGNVFRCFLAVTWPKYPVKATDQDAVFRSNGATFAWSKTDFLGTQARVRATWQRIEGTTAIIKLYQAASATLVTPAERRLARYIIPIDAGACQHAECALDWTSPVQSQPVVQTRLVLRKDLTTTPGAGRDIDKREYFLHSACAKVGCQINAHPQASRWWLTVLGAAALLVLRRTGKYTLLGIGLVTIGFGTTANAATVQLYSTGADGAGSSMGAVEAVPGSIIGSTEFDPASGQCAPLPAIRIEVGNADRGTVGLGLRVDPDCMIRVFDDPIGPPTTEGGAAGTVPTETTVATDVTPPSALPRGEGSGQGVPDCFRFIRGITEVEDGITYYTKRVGVGPWFRITESSVAFYGYDDGVCMAPLWTPWIENYALHWTDWVHDSTVIAALQHECAEAPSPSGPRKVMNFLNRGDYHWRGLQNLGPVLPLFDNYMQPLPRPAYYHYLNSFAEMQPGGFVGVVCEYGGTLPNFVPATNSIFPLGLPIVFEVYCGYRWEYWDCPTHWTVSQPENGYLCDAPGEGCL